MIGRLCGVVGCLALVWAVGCGGDDGGSSDGDTTGGTTGGTSTSGTGGGTSNSTSNSTSGGTTGGSGNRAPTLDKIGSKRARLGRELAFEVMAEDPDGDRLSFSVFGELPEGAKFDKTTRRFTWTPSPSQLGQLVILTFAVSDGDLEDRETVQMTVVEGGDNSPPELLNPGDQIVRAGETLELQLEATDPDGDALQFSIDGPAPASGALDPETGLFTWTPTLDDQGASLRVLFVVSDGQAQDDALVRLVVSELELTLGEIDAQQVRLNEELRFALPIDNPAGLAVACSVVGQLPSGASFDPSSCTFAWTPTDAALVGQSVEVGFQVEADEGGEPVVLITTATIAILPPEQMNDPCTEDPFEPNDFIEDATTVTSDGFLETGLTVCEGDWDVYRVELTQGQQLDVLALFEHAQKDLDIDLYLGDAETPLLTSWSVTDNEQITLAEAPEDGTYYIEVYSLQAGQAQYDISIEIQESSACADDANEPNNSPEAATSVADGFESEAIICPDNPDLYRARLSQGQLLRTTIIFDGREGDLDLRVTSPSGMTWSSAGVRDIEEVIVPSTDAAGDWLIEVYGFSGATTGYLIEVAVSDGVPCDPDSSEPNNTVFEPTELSSPEVELLERTACGDADWYRFVAPAGAEVVAGISGDGVADLRFRAWDEDGEFLFATGVADGQINDMVLDAFPNETPILFSVDSGIGVTYDLEVLAF